MIRLFANANYDFIKVAPLGLRAHGPRSSSPDFSLFLVRA